MKLILIAALLALTGCGVLERNYAQVTGKPAEVCVHNVVYLQFTSGVTPMYGVNGLIVTCDN